MTNIEYYDIQYAPDRTKSDLPTAGFNCSPHVNVALAAFTMASLASE